MNFAMRFRGAVLFTLATLAVYVVSTGFNLFTERLYERLFESQTYVVTILLGMVGFALLGFLLVFTLFPTINRQIGAKATVRLDDELDARTHLITGYSPLTGRRTVPAPEAYRAIPDAAAACHPDRRAILDSWQQNVRVIHALARAGPLKAVYVINPSHDQFAEFRAMLAHFFPELDVRLVTRKGRDKPFTVTHGPAGAAQPDYEDFNYVIGAVRRALDMIREATGLSRRDLEDKVAIDITPGYKIFSVAGAIVSLNSGILAIYASTFGEREMQVKAYDASIALFTHGA